MTQHPQAAFYVATNGNDAWSGTLAEPNAARTDGPFATLERDRDAVRPLKGGVTVWVRGPTRATPFHASRRSARGRSITYRACERAVHSWRHPVTNWQPVSDPPSWKPGPGYWRTSQ